MTLWPRRAGALIAVAGVLTLAGCQSSQAVSRSLECSKDREYSAPGAPACAHHGQNAAGPRHTGAGSRVRLRAGHE